MLDDSLFASDTIHERDIKLSDGTTHKMYFRELSAAEFRRYALDNESEDEDRRADSMASLIVAGLVTPDGKKALTLERAKRLKPSPFLAIFNAVQEVNQSSKKSDPSGGSGTS